jgi:hypothetical protein
MANAFQLSQLVHVAAQLNIGDLLASGPRTIEELAQATNTHEPSLKRLLRALAAVGVVSEEADGRLSLTSTGVPLRSDVPGSLRDTLRFVVGPWLWRSWGELLESVTTGQPAFDRLWGMSNFDYWRENPQVGELHDRFFTAMAALTAPQIAAAYDFGRFGTVVDVGGSEGALLAAVLEAHPKTRGILFDLPHVVATAPEFLSASGVAGRCEIVAGDFFSSVPDGGDAYVLKSVLHDWSDEQCGQIVQQCRKAMAPEGKLLVVEQVFPDRIAERPSTLQTARLDLAMLLQTQGGRERTQSEYAQLLGGAGLELEEAVRTASPFSILVFRKGL